MKTLHTIYTNFAKRVLMALALITMGVSTAWGQYTKATSIAAGDVVLLVCDSKKNEFNGLSKDYGTGKSYSTAPNGAHELTVRVGSNSGTYSFEYTNSPSYLSWSSGNTLIANNSITQNSSWVVTFDSDGNATIKNAKDNARKLQWNASSPRFACYTSSQTAVQLYKKGSSKVNPTATFADGTYTIGGANLDLSTLWSSNSTGTVTYSITNDNGTGATCTSAGSFSATTAGSCTVQASQAATTGYNAIIKTATITVSAPAGGGNDSDGCTWELVTDASTSWCLLPLK